MTHLVCTVEEECLTVVDPRGTHNFEQTKRDVLVPSQVVFTDIDRYWEAVRRGPPPRRVLERSA